MRINGRLIHSSYNPEKEAERYIAQYNFKPGNYIFLVIGAGEGYIRKALKKNFSHPKILSVFLQKELFELAPESSLSWYFGSSISLEYFLSLNIQDILISSLRIIEWSPCIKTAPEKYRIVGSILGNFLSERNASIVTTINFGKRWLRNSILNITNSTIFTYLKNVNLPVVIAASGPSLSLSITAFRTYRKKFFLISLPSSLLALESAGIIPDLIVNTDPGFWNSYHFMRYKYQTIPIAMPITGIFTPLDNPVLLINQGTFLETEILKKSKLTGIDIPQNGTVSATALMLAMNITKQPVFIAGLDLYSPDILEHCEPHAFTLLLRQTQSKLNPLLTTLYNRSLHAVSYRDKQSRALHTYENWFNRTIFKHTIYRINSSVININPFINIGTSEFINILQHRPLDVNTNFFKSIKRKTITQKQQILLFIEETLDKINEYKTKIINFTSLEGFVEFIQKDPLLYNIIELIQLQDVLKGIQILIKGNILESSFVINIFTNTENYLGELKILCRKY